MEQRKDGIQNIKEELEAVIELMGPSTPQLISTSSMEGNEESMISTSVYSSVVEVKKTSRKDVKQTSSDTPRDISEMSALPIDISETTEPIENPDVHSRHNVETCPCRQYYNIINAVSQNVQDSQPKTQSYEKFSFQKLLESKNNKERGLSLLNLFKFRRPERELEKEPLDLYKINILQANDQNIPRRLTFDLIDNIPRPNMNTVATNTSKVSIITPTYCQVNRSVKSTSIPATAVHISHLSPKAVPPQSARESCRSNLATEKPARVDVYYFDHGNSCYLKTTDMVPVLSTEVFAEKTEAYTAKFWAETFGTIHIFFAFLTTFLLQFLKFILQSLVRPLTVGLVQLTSDYFFKPCLTVCFNAIIQPPAILLFNILTSLRDLCDPIAEGIGYFLHEIANLCRSVRLVEVKNNHQTGRSPLRRTRLRRKK